MIHPVYDTQIGGQSGNFTINMHEEKVHRFTI